MDAERVKADCWAEIGTVRALFQPVVNLVTGNVVGYEALLRGPDGGGYETPDRLFAAARERGLIAQLDWACRAAAFESALAEDLYAPLTLFVNVEPEALHTPCPPELRDTMATGRRKLRTIFEITERALADRPAELLRVVEELRHQGAGIALDDVGADWRSLALMPFIRPDVVKLDMRLIQSPLTPHGAIVAEAVRAYADRSGAQIVAEGIETDAHLQRARGLGATFGQGFMFGRPEALPRQRPRRIAAAPDLVIAHQPGDDGSPMTTIAHLTNTAIAPKADLVAMSRAIEQRALDTTEPCVILTAFEALDRFTPGTVQLYRTLAQRSAFVGVFGRGMPPEPAPGVRGADLALNDQLGEWAVILVAPHYAVALVAQDLGDQGPDMQRRYRYAILNDRDLVLPAARALMVRTRPVSGTTTVRERAA